MDPLLEALNHEQRAAVTLPRTAALVLAGAGSGKTRVLTTRIARLIQTGQAKPSEILAVTFTNKAAKEMLTRVAAMLPIDTRGMWVGTFHGLAHRLLRAHHREAGLPQLFQILDAQDQLAFVKRLLKSLNEDEERTPPRELAYFIASAKEQGLRPSAVDTPDERSARFNELYAAYDAACAREGVVDFAELMLRSFELLARNETLARHYRVRFSHILVDEFQDTSAFQYAWLKMLAGPDGAVFAVGDDDQSIYAFRGADSRNMQVFLREFQVERVIRLEQNYRSQGIILDAANALISHNRARLGKNLWTAAGRGEPIRLIAAPSDQEEAQAVVAGIRAAHEEEGLPLGEIAVLYRSNAQSRVIEHALFSAGVPYRVYGGLRFFERQEIKHALAYLRLIANPDDDNALLRVINVPARGIGGRTVEALVDAARERGCSLWAAACARGGREVAKGVPAFVLLVEALRRETAGMRLPDVVAHVLDRSGLIGYYRAAKHEVDRVENLEELVNAAAAFAEEYGVDTPEDLPDVLTAFLSHAALEAGEHQAEAGRDAVQLMTVHAAKGLEFDCVFVTGLEEGLFPHENSLYERGGVEEERRLMYVAITRARRRLVFSFAATRMLHGQVRYGLPSRFLEEIPAELIEPLAVGEAKGRAFPSPGGFSAGKSEDPNYRIGQTVIHAKFGPGVIVDCAGRGADLRVQVNFRDGGLKWLAVEYARLMPG